MRHCNQSVKSQRRRWRKRNLACYNFSFFFAVCLRFVLKTRFFLVERFLIVFRAEPFDFLLWERERFFFDFVLLFVLVLRLGFDDRRRRPFFVELVFLFLLERSLPICFFTVSRKVVFRAAFGFVRPSIIPSTSSTALCTKFLAKGRPYRFASGITKLFKPRRSAEPSPLPY